MLLHLIERRILQGCMAIFVLAGSLQGQNTPLTTELPKSSNRYAILVGVGKYSDPNIVPLSDPPLDVKALQQALEKSAGFFHENISVLSDDPGNLEPTRTNILTELSKIKNSVSGDSLLLLMFAGHGIVTKQDGRAFVLPKDAKLTEDVLLLSDTSIPVDLLRARIANTQVKQAIVLLDTCRDDPLAAHGLSNNALNQTFKESFDLLNKEIQASAIIFATGLGGRAYVDANRQLGYFSEMLVDGLNGDAAGPNGSVTLQGLIDYIQTNVPKRVSRDLAENQQPIYDVAGYKANDLVLATKASAIPLTVHDGGGQPVTVDAATTPSVVVGASSPDPRVPSTLRFATYDFQSMFASYSGDEFALANLGEDSFLKGNYEWTIKYLEQAKKIQSSKVWMSEYPFLAAAYLLGNNNEIAFRRTLEDMLQEMSIPNTFLHNQTVIGFCLTRLNTIKRLVPDSATTTVDDVIAQVQKISGSGGLPNQTASQVCTFYGEAPHGGHAWLKQDSCIIPDVEHLDHNFHASHFNCCGGGAESPTTAANIPAGIELLTVGSVYWSVANPVLDSDKFSLTTYCGPSAATLTSEGCSVKVTVLAHYRY